MRADNGSQSTPTERPKNEFHPFLGLTRSTRTARTHVSVSSVSLGVAARHSPEYPPPPFAPRKDLTRPAAIPY